MFVCAYGKRLEKGLRVPKQKKYEYVLPASFWCFFFFVTDYKVEWTLFRNKKLIRRKRCCSVMKIEVVYDSGDSLWSLWRYSFNFYTCFVSFLNVASFQLRYGLHATVPSDSSSKELSSSGWSFANVRLANIAVCTHRDKVRHLFFSSVTSVRSIT